METTLKVLRSQIINMLFNGPQPDDSQLKADFFNQMILDARAHVIWASFLETKTVDDELYTPMVLDVTKESSAFGTTFRVEIPKLIKLANNLELKVKGPGNDLGKIVYYEILKKERIPYYKKNIYANGDPVCCRTGNKIEFFSKKEIKRVELEAIVYDPTQVEGFDEDSSFPVTASTINAMKDVISKLDINMLIRGEKDTTNDSVPFISRAEAPQNQGQ